MKLMLLTRNKSHCAKLFVIEEWNNNQRLYNIAKWEMITIIPAKSSMLTADIPIVWCVGEYSNDDTEITVAHTDIK